jgi:VRR-NUC domain
MKPSDLSALAAKLPLSKSVVALNQDQPDHLPDTGKMVEREDKLHRDIMEWCDGQWPRWKYIHHRMDKKSGIAVGAQDLTIFGPHPLCILVECKSKDGKLSDDQRNWAHEMLRLRWTVHIVRSMADFMAIARTLCPASVGEEG